MNAQGASSMASLNGQIMPVAEATIPITDEGLVRGDGAFEVMRVYDGQPYAFEAHMARLSRSADNIRLEVDLELVRAEVSRLLAHAGPGPDHELVRIMLTRGGRRILLTEPIPPTPQFLRLKSMTYSPTRVLDGVKSLSYAANMLAGRLAREQGYDEAILVTPHGSVLEAPTASIFWVCNGELLTPPLDEHILASITRALIIELTGAREQVCPLEELLAADEAFIASTAREVHPVIAIDERSLPVPGPVTARTATAVAESIQAEISG